MKLIYLLSRYPYPLNKGDQLRAYQQIKYLSAFCEVHVFALTDINIPESFNKELTFVKSIKVVKLYKLSIACRLFVNFFKKEPFQIAYFYSKPIQKALNTYIENIKPDIVFCQLPRMAEYCKFINIPCVLDYQDAFAWGLAKRIETKKLITKWLFKLEASRMAKYEAEILPYFVKHFIISEQDRQHLNIPNKNQVHIIPNFIENKQVNDIENRDIDLLFVGNMSYEPNVECVKFICNYVMPLVLKQNKSIVFYIVGANPTKDVLALANNNIIVTGTVPLVEPYYLRSKVFIAPIFIGTGLQNKLLEAMLYKVPIITSTLCNSALKAIPNTSIVIAEQPTEIKNAIFNLLENKEFHKSIVLNAQTFVKEHYSESHCGEILYKELVEIIR